MGNLRLVVFSALLCLLLSNALPVSASTLDFPMLWSADLNGENRNLRAADLDGDGKGEIVADSVYIAAGLGKSGLVMAFEGNGSVLWTYHAGMLEDVRTASNGYTAVGAWGYAVLLDTAGDAALKRSLRTGPTTIMAQRAYTTDLDGDGLSDIFSSINFGMKGSHLYAWDGKGEYLFRKSYKGLEFPNAFNAVDLDGDGRKEILVGVMRFSTNTLGQKYDEAPEKAAYIEAVDLGGNVLWSFDTEGGVTVVGVNDVNDDGSPEILVGNPHRIYALDSKGNLLWKVNLDGTVEVIDFGDLNADGKNEVLVGAGKIYVLNHKGDLVWSHVSGTVYSVKAVDLDEDGQSEVLVGSSTVRYLESDGSLVWKSDSFRHVRGLDTMDLDGDGFPEIIAGCSDSTLRVFSTADYLMKNKADFLYQQAIEYSAGRNYLKCVEYSSNSTDYYSKIGDVALSSRSATARDRCLKFIEASGYMNQSSGYFGTGDYAKAASEVEKALDVYRQLGDMRGVNDASSLKERIRLTPLSGEYLNYSITYFIEGLYENSSFYATESKSAYLYLGDMDGVSKAQEVMDNVSRMRAYLLVEKALNYSELGFVNASDYLLEANDTFVRLNDTEGLLAVEEAAAVVYSRMSRAETFNSITSAIDSVVKKIADNIMVIIAFIIVGVLVLLILVAAWLSLYIMRGGDEGTSKRKKPPGKYLLKYSVTEKDKGRGLTSLEGKLGKGDDGIPLF